MAVSVEEGKERKKERKKKKEKGRGERREVHLRIGRANVEYEQTEARKMPELRVFDRKIVSFATRFCDG